MAPTYKEIAPLRNALAKLERKIEAIKEIDELILCKNEYLFIREDILNFLNQYHLGLKVNFDTPDKVTHWEGGVGLYLGDSRSSEIIEILNKEIQSKKRILIEVAKMVPDFLINKKEGIYYISNKPILIGKNTQAYHLIDILYSLGNQDGYSSYREIIAEFEKRKKNKEFKTDKEVGALNSHDVLNIREQLFKTARIGSEKFKNKTPNGLDIIEVVRGKGLKLNNSST